MREFESAQLKIDRANHHISDFDVRRDIFLATNPCKFRREHNSQTGNTDYIVEEVVDVDPVISLVIGDAIHNLRSALDHLAVALVRDNGQPPTKGTYFPMGDSASKYQTAAPGQVKGMSVPDAKRIDGLKPYLGGDDRFWGLHRMDITDKHNLILTQTQCVGGINYAISDAGVDDMLRGMGIHGFYGDSPSVEKKPILIPWTGPLLIPKKCNVLISIPGNQEKNEDMQPSFDIAFGDVEVFKGKPVSATLRDLADLVQRVIKTFV